MIANVGDTILPAVWDWFILKIYKIFVIKKLVEKLTNCLNWTNIQTWNKINKILWLKLKYLKGNSSIFSIDFDS